MPKSQVLRNFVRAIADGLSPLLPPGVTLSEREGSLLVSTRLGDDCILVADNIEMNVATGLSTPEAIEGSAGCMMNELQDIVTTYLTTPWPAKSEAQPFDFSSPNAEIEGDALYLWFGERERRVNAIRIPLPTSDGGER